LIKDEIFKILKDKALTQGEISKNYGYNESTVRSVVNKLFAQGRLILVGKLPGRTHDRDVYTAFSYKQITRKQIKLPTNQVHQPFSQDEEHYGADGQKWCWDDVKYEAIMVKYKSGSAINYFQYSFE